MSRHLVVGASPLLLLDALQLARRGGDVVVVDPDPIGSGSWGTVEVAGHRLVENACHLLEHHPPARAVLEGAGVRFRPLSPPARLVLRPGWRVRYGSPVVPLVQLCAAPLTALRATRGARAYVAEVVRRIRSLVPATIRAARTPAPDVRFDGGAGAMRAALLAAVEAAGARLVVGRVESVRVGGEAGVEVALSGAIERFDGVTMSAAFDAELVVDGQVVEVERRRRQHRHVVLVVEPGSIPPLSYLHFPFDSTLVRVSDVTDAASRDDGTADAQLLLVQVRPERGRDLDGVRAALARHGVLPIEASTRVERWVEFESVDGYASLAATASSAASGGVLVVRSTHGDLMRTIDEAIADGWLRAGS